MQKEYNISVFTENHIGLLNRITIVFSRRKINIESLTVSESALKGISKFTIVINTTEDRVKQVVNQIEKIVDVLKAYYHTNEEMIYQEIALYKVPTDKLFDGNQVETIIRNHGARILEVDRDFIFIEKTGHPEDTQRLFDELQSFDIQQFIRSGRVAITKSPIEKLSVFLKERDELLKSIN
ncbi:MAG: acetolactate synthase small subunit [Bacteroidales bacterium]